MNKLFKIQVFHVENDRKPITEYKSRVAPEMGDDIRINNEIILNISHREFNSDNPAFIKVFGYTEEGF